MQHTVRATTRNMAYSALFAVLSSILMLFEAPLPLLPTWLKLDVSSLPVLFAGYMLGPVWCLAVQGVKSLIALLHTSTGGVGELADFLMGSALCLPATLFYMRGRSVKNAVVGMGVGIVCICAMGVLTNAFLLMPLFLHVSPRELFSGAAAESAGKLFGAASQRNAAITGLASYLVYAVIPFNFVKGVLVCAVTLPIYRRLAPFLTRRAKPEALEE